MVKQIPLTRGLFALVDDADYERLAPFNWVAAGSARSGVYAGRNATVGGKRIKVWMHREVCPAASGLVVDHINGDALDNRRANLRQCTQKENMRNRRHWSGREYRGVHPRRGGYLAIVTVDGRQVSRGSYASPIHAAVAYDEMARELFGEFAKLNFSPDRDWILPTPSVAYPARKRGASWP